MQFVENGPDIPNRLLKAHEEGDVVFFCGAGISYQADLPSFEGLADRIFKNLHITLNMTQQLAMDERQFDRAIGLLEEKIVDGRWLVRKELERILKPDLSAKYATATHKNLLTLSKSREGRTQLVTTNFDRLFEEIIDKEYPLMERFLAPLLPVPKKSQWDGLVYLHGLLKENSKVSDLDRLVVSSGDFGLAYLTERWAARFVSELLRNYTVCFVGYSIDDPILRYMMDALSASRLRGESSTEMFAFGGYPKGKENDISNKWQSKNVTPILYDERNEHAYLRDTLHEWARIYNDRENGKKKIIDALAHKHPLKDIEEDDFIVGRMLWALSDLGGEPARYFSEIDPVPSLDWLKYLENIIDTSDQKSEVDNARWHMWRWLIRHIDDPKLLYFLANQKNRLHHKFVWLFEYHMNELINLERDNNTLELEKIRENAPNSIPCLQMRKFWNLLLVGRIRFKENDTGFEKFHMHRWCERFRRDGLTLETRLNLLENLMPKILLVELNERSNSSEPNTTKSSIRWETVLSVDNVCREIKNLSNNKQWIDCLPDLLPKFTCLLQDALLLTKEIKTEDNKIEKLYCSQPSITGHPQNIRLRDWELLIDLTRDAWLKVAEKSPDRAAIEAKRWWDMSCPLFRRLALFAASHSTVNHGFVISARCALDWLLADECRWLWLDIANQEVMCLLKRLAPRLEKEMLIELEKSILDGPPSDPVRDSPDPSIRDLIEEQEICHRLKRIIEGGVVLGKDAKKLLDDFFAKYEIQETEIKDRRDEIPSVIRLFKGEIVAIPRNLPDMTNWIRQNPIRDRDQEDDWRQCCHDDFNMTSDALCALAKENNWPSGRWQEALCAWSGEEFLQKSWNKMAPILVKAPINLLQDIAYDMGKWLQSIAKTFEEHEEVFFILISRILDIEHEDCTISDNPVDCAINHPIGFVTEALIHWWNRKSPRDSQGLPKEIKFIFSNLCDRKIEKYRYGRILLAVQSIELFRVDRKWAESYLLPLFSWYRFPDDARLIWGGFLHTSCQHRPLIESLKRSILDTTNHYSELGSLGGKYIRFFIAACLNSGHIFTDDELREAAYMLPLEGLNELVIELVDILERSGENRDKCWTNQIEPYLRRIWPKDRDKITSPIPYNLCRLCLAAQENFLNALSLLRHWFRDTEDYSYPFINHQESYLFESNPSEALDFLIYITDREAPFWLPLDNVVDNIKGCLDAILKFNPDFENDDRYRKLKIYISKHKHD